MSSDPSQEIIKSVSEGVTKGALEYTEDRIKLLVKKILNRDLYFIQDADTIDVVKEMRKTEEFEFFKENVQDKNLRILFSMGLTLRKLEKERKPIEPLRKKILKKYDAKGLHIAQFVQAGLFYKYLGILSNELMTREKIKKEINELFENIENICVFIQTGDSSKDKVREIITKLDAHSPKIFVACSAGTAMEKCEKTKKDVIKGIRNYSCEIYDSQNKKIFFLLRNKADTIGNSSS
jgi:hypothetical protein